MSRREQNFSFLQKNTQGMMFIDMLSQYSNRNMENDHAEGDLVIASYFFESDHSGFSSSIQQNVGYAVPSK